MEFSEGDATKQKSVKRSAFIHWMGYRHAVNEGVSIYRKGNSVKRFRPFSELSDSNHWNFLRSSPSQISAPSWFWGRGWGQQLFSFQSPAVHWMAGTSSLNWLSCRNPYQTPHSLHAPPTKKAFFRWKVLRRPPFPKIGPHIISEVIQEPLPLKPGILVKNRSF